MDLVNKIDYTKLGKLNLDSARELARQTNSIGFRSLCIQPTHIRKVSRMCPITAAIGFPNIEDPKKAKELFSWYDSADKIIQMDHAITRGASSVDIVVNPEDYQEDIRKIFNYISNRPYVRLRVRLILSLEVLKDDSDKLESFVNLVSGHIHSFNRKYLDTNVLFSLKTSTGLLKEKYTPDDLKFLIKLLDLYDVGKSIKVKVSGGIKTKKDAEELSKICGKRLDAIGMSEPWTLKKKTKSNTKMKTTSI